MTNNHPNRNQRQRMQQAADRWLSTVPIPADGVLYYATVDDFRKLLRTAYVAGYTVGRRTAKIAAE